MTVDHNARNLIMLTAGGTGGHLFPALALAESLKKRGYDILIVTDERGGRFQNEQQEFDIEILNVTSPSGNVLQKAKSALTLTAGYFKARQLLRKYKPSVVVGFGGYPSFPLMLAAQHGGIKNVIHEQNAVIGKANLMIARNADKIAISLPRITGLSSSEEQRVTFTGNPVRAAIQILHGEEYTPPESDHGFNIFLLGGSQGASVFSDIVPGALARLPAQDRARLQIVQQCRPEDIERTAEAYQSAEITCEVAPFFHDIPYRLRTAHLVISRSGASTVAEVTTAGRPAIFVPYPWHKDQQQKMNADVIADNGGAWVMAQDGFTQDALEARMLMFLQDPDILSRAARASRECAVPDAAEKLADVVGDLAGLSKNRNSDHDAQFETHSVA